MGMGSREVVGESALLGPHGLSCLRKQGDCKDRVVYPS